MKTIIACVVLVLFFAGCAAFTPRTYSPYEMCLMECQIEYRKCMKTARYALKGLIQDEMVKACVKHARECNSKCKVQE